MREEYLKQRKAEEERLRKEAWEAKKRLAEKNSRMAAKKYRSEQRKLAEDRLNKQRQRDQNVPHTFNQPSPHRPFSVPDTSRKPIISCHAGTTGSDHSTSSTRGRRHFDRSPAPSPPRIPKNFSPCSSSGGGLPKGSPTRSETLMNTGTPVSRSSFPGLGNQTRRHSKRSRPQFLNLCDNCGATIDHEASAEHCPEDELWRS